MQLALPFMDAMFDFEPFIRTREELMCMNKQELEEYNRGWHDDMPMHLRFEWNEALPSEATSAALIKIAERKLFYIRAEREGDLLMKELATKR
jgi:hypothetical protein